MNKKFRLFAASLLAICAFGLAGCQTASDAKVEPTISKSEIVQYTKTGAVEGSYIQGDLDLILSIGREVGAHRVLGTVVDILHPVTLQVDEMESVWVPVVLKVEQSDPKLPEETYKFRLFANSENRPDLNKIHIGQRVLAIGSKLTTDQAGVEAISLGWLLGVAPDGTLTDLNPNHQVSGNFNDFTDLLRMEPLN